MVVTNGAKSGFSATWVEPFKPEDSSPVASVTRTRHARTSAASAFSGDLRALRLHLYSICWLWLHILLLHQLYIGAINRAATTTQEAMGISYDKGIEFRSYPHRNSK